MYVRKYENVFICIYVKKFNCMYVNMKICKYVNMYMCVFSFLSVSFLDTHMHR